eukprot:3736324-Karenia_brevis.AAC.1
MVECSGRVHLETAAAGGNLPRWSTEGHRLFCCPQGLRTAIHGRACQFTLEGSLRIQLGHTYGNP